MTEPNPVNLMTSADAARTFDGCVVFDADTGTVVGAGNLLLVHPDDLDAATLEALTEDDDSAQREAIARCRQLRDYFPVQLPSMLAQWRDLAESADPFERGKAAAFMEILTLLSQDEVTDTRRTSRHGQP